MLKKDVLLACQKAQQVRSLAAALQPPGLVFEPCRAALAVMADAEASNQHVMQVALPLDAAREPPSSRGRGPGVVAAPSGAAAGAAGQPVNSTSADSTAARQLGACLALAARAWSLGHCGSGGAPGSAARVRNGHRLDPGHTEHAASESVTAPCPAASAPPFQRPVPLMRTVTTGGGHVATLLAAERAAALLQQPEAHPAQLRSAGPEPQAGPAAGAPLVPSARVPDTTLQPPQHDQAPPNIWPGSFLHSSRQQQQQQQCPSSPRHAQHDVVEPEQLACDAPALVSSTTHDPFGGHKWLEALPEEVSVPVVIYLLSAHAHAVSLVTRQSTLSFAPPARSSATEGAKCQPTRTFACQLSGGQRPTTTCGRQTPARMRRAPRTAPASSCELAVLSPPAG